MKKNNIFLTLISVIVFSGCTTLQVPKYRDGEPRENFGYPTGRKIERSFYLLGDGGYSKPGGPSDALLAFKVYVDSVRQAGNYTLFLGDNIYPQGLVPESHPDRKKAEFRLDAQIDAVENYDGKILFIPGNHDWYNQGVVGVQRQEEYLQEKLGRNDVFAPRAGCALESIVISETLQLLVVDSEWYLTDWDKNPTINRNCPEIKTREALFLEVETELKKNQNKTVIFAIHHPLYTNGVHGGHFDFNQHLFPAHKMIPLPILGSLANFIRTTGGISTTDIQNERYKAMRRRLETIATRWGNVIFVSGHDHSLQYIEHDHIKQIVSGSASKASYAGLSNDGLFAFPGQGFVVLDVFADGSSWASYYGSIQKKPKLLYQTQVFPAPEPFRTDTLPDNFPQRVKASIYEPEQTRKGQVYESVWGDRYRELYGTKIEVPVVDLDTLYGGLEVMRAGGGHQTRSLRLQDRQGRDYNMRALEKSAVQFLQTVAFKDVPVQSRFENTLAQEVIKDFYTSAHPYAFLAIPTLSKAADVLHTNPRLYYVPKQKSLGPYNREFGDELYMIVERPEDKWMDHESFGNPNHDIESTAGVFERLRRDEKYSLNEESYIRARIFDMLIGDWDRHEDQWRWAESEDEEGNHIFEPIPRDRDQAFSNFDGAFLNTLRGLTGFANQFAVYDGDIDDIEWFNSAAVGLDRRLIQNAGRETWLEQARFIQDKVTDDVIEKAFNNLPEATRGESAERIKKSLRARRGNIVDIAERYYNYFAETAIISATDKDDHIDVERLSNGRTRVTIFRIKGGEKAEVVSSKTYNSNVTKEIWVYGLDDDDIFAVYGEGNDLILTRLIGGHDHDRYRVHNGKRIRIYDHKSLPNTVERNNGGRIFFTDNYDVNIFDKDRKIYSNGNIAPGMGYNPDEGFRIGLQGKYSFYGFRRNPFTAQHRISGGYYFGTNTFDLRYRGEFGNFWGNYNLLVGGHFESPDYIRNFFGFGNETVNPEDELTMDYNRIGVNSLGAEAGFVRDSPFGSYFRYLLSFEGVEVRPYENRFIPEEYVPDQQFYQRKYFTGLEGTYRYESYDDILNPTNGMKFEVSAGARMNVRSTDQTFGYVDSYLEFYKTVTRNEKWVLNPRILADIRIGNDFEFYQSATLGDENGLRGYRHRRFSGENAFATGIDLRYGFERFRTRFLPVQIGLFAGYDIGRVWIDGEDSNVWHDSYGGGLWINSAEAVSGRFNFFAGGEGLRFSFTFGLNF